ncbi:hypothetical protein F4823DRAFT_63109 [Ustulina deusta]|nr:hypothetical protein F4823DRAFT_63109 [Ustulina deusta]
MLQVSLPSQSPPPTCLPTNTLPGPCSIHTYIHTKSVSCNPFSRAALDPPVSRPFIHIRIHAGVVMYKIVTRKAENMNERTELKEKRGNIK